ncbi:MAG: hypothetical protein Kow0090_13250 [Myxococcota bacterium]
MVPGFAGEYKVMKNILIALFIVLSGVCLSGCVGDMALLGEPNVKCDKEHPCQSGYFCLEGGCIAESEAENSLLEKEIICAEDTHCPAGLKCVENTCRMACENDAGCPKGAICKEGYCFSAELGGDGKTYLDGGNDDDYDNPDECFLDSDCRFKNGYAACINNRCVLTGCILGFSDRNRDDRDGCEYQCSKGAMETCNGLDDNCNGQIDEDSTLCDEGLNCYEGKCVQPCAVQCEKDGETRCTSLLSLQICVYNETADCLEWSSSVQCPDGMMCEEGRCTPSCKSNCEREGAKECLSDSSYRACVRSGDCLVWSGAKECDDFCLNGECVECTNSAQCPKDHICDSKTFTCKYTTCVPECKGKVCGADGCGGTCGSCSVVEKCVQGACECRYVSERCNGICCNAGEQCVSGVCCPDLESGGCSTDGKEECHPTDSKLNRVCVRKSNGCLVWSAYEPCPNGGNCSADGTCPISNQCYEYSAYRCSGDKKSVERCLDRDNDGKMEWGFFEECAAICIDAECKECGSSAHCSEPTPVCDTSVYKCVECLGDVHCASPTPKCSPERNCVECLADPNCPPQSPKCNGEYICVECLLDSDCPESEPKCKTDNTCVECLATSDCVGADVDKCNTTTNICQCGNNPPCSGNTPYCLSGVCRACAQDSHCSGSTPFCVSGQCVECKQASDCPPSANQCASGQCRCGSNPPCSGDLVCDSGACVQCLNDSHCKNPAKPYCRTSTKECVECTQNSHCSSNPNGNVCRDQRFCGCNTDSNCLTPEKKICDNNILNNPSYLCVECLSHTHCPYPHFKCANKSCLECTITRPCACNARSDCPPMLPSCQSNICVPCDGMTNCGCSDIDPFKCSEYSYYPRCINDHCVQCTENSHCADHIEGEKCGAGGSFANMCGCSSDNDCGDYWKTCSTIGTKRICQ